MDVKFIRWDNIDASNYRAVVEVDREEQRISISLAKGERLTEDVILGRISAALESQAYDPEAVAGDFAKAHMGKALNLEKVAAAWPAPAVPRSANKPHSIGGVGNDGWLARLLKKLHLQ